MCCVLLSVQCFLLSYLRGLILVNRVELRKSSSQPPARMLLCLLWELMRRVTLQILTLYPMLAAPPTALLPLLRYCYCLLRHGRCFGNYCFLVLTCQNYRSFMTDLALLRALWPLCTLSLVWLFQKKKNHLVGNGSGYIVLTMPFLILTQLPRKLLMDPLQRTGEVEELLHSTSFLAALELQR